MHIAIFVKILIKNVFYTFIIFNNNNKIIGIKDFKYLSFKCYKFLIIFNKQNKFYFFRFHIINKVIIINCIY